jgi:hypothetical protein
MYTLCIISQSRMQWCISASETSETCHYALRVVRVDAARNGTLTEHKLNSMLI